MSSKPITIQLNTSDFISAEKFKELYDHAKANNKLELKLSGCSGCSPKIPTPLTPFRYKHLPKSDARKILKKLYNLAHELNRQNLPVDHLLCLIPHPRKPHHGH